MLIQEGGDLRVNEEEDALQGLKEPAVVLPSGAATQPSGCLMFDRYSRGTVMITGESRLARRLRGRREVEKETAERRSSARIREQGRLTRDLSSTLAALEAPTRPS